MGPGSPGDPADHLLRRIEPGGDLEGASPHGGRGDTVKPEAADLAAPGVGTVTYQRPEWELVTPAGTLAVASTSTTALFGAGAARAADNHSVIIEFRVDDVDAEYERLRALPVDVVKEPATMPWGNRSLLFRDPDGNLVNLFTPVTAEAASRTER
ncbi:MAG TPA: VOC family protein [Streptosporangiaceae bacterium]